MNKEIFIIRDKFEKDVWPIKFNEDKTLQNYKHLNIKRNTVITKSEKDIYIGEIINNESFEFYIF